MAITRYRFKKPIAVIPMGSMAEFDDTPRQIVASVVVHILGTDLKLFLGRPYLEFLLKHDYIVEVDDGSSRD